MSIHNINSNIYVNAKSYITRQFLGLS